MIAHAYRCSKNHPWEEGASKAEGGRVRVGVGAQVKPAVQ